MKPQPLLHFKRWEKIVLFKFMFQIKVTEEIGHYLFNIFD